MPKTNPSSRPSPLMKGRRRTLAWFWSMRTAWIFGINRFMGSMQEKAVSANSHADPLDLRKGEGNRQSGFRRREWFGFSRQSEFIAFLLALSLVLNCFRSQAEEPAR